MSAESYTILNIIFKKTDLLLLTVIFRYLSSEICEVVLEKEAISDHFNQISH